MQKWYLAAIHLPLLAQYWAIYCCPIVVFIDEPIIGQKWYGLLVAISMANNLLWTISLFRTITEILCSPQKPVHAEGANAASFHFLSITLDSIVKSALRLREFQPRGNQQPMGTQSYWWKLGEFRQSRRRSSQLVNWLQYHQKLYRRKWRHMRLPRLVGNL